MQTIKILPIICSVAFLLGACSSTQKNSDAGSVQKKQQKTTTTASSTVKCSLDKDQRSLEVKATDNGCELLYTKFTETKSVAKSAKGLNHCQKSQSKIKNALEEAGFKCE